MKRTLISMTVLLLWLSACSGATSNAPATEAGQPAATLTQPATATATPPSATPTITPTPTAALPAQIGTPFKSPEEAISLQNAGRVAALASWGGGTLSSLDLSPDGTTLAAAGSIGVTLYAADTLQQLGTFPTSEGVKEISFAADGQTLALALPDGVLLWNLAGATTPLDLAGPANEQVFSVDYSADGKWLAVGVSDGVKIFEAGTGQFVKHLQNNEAEGGGVVFSPDSKMLAVAMTAGSQAYADIRFWDTGTWQMQERAIQRMDVDDSAGLAFSADGKTLAVSGGWYSIGLYNLEDDTTVYASARECCNGFEVVALSPDGKTAAGGGYYGLLYLWDTASGALLHVLQEEDLRVQGLAFSADGRTLIAGSIDGVRLWEVASGRKVASAVSHASYGKIISVSPDGKRVATLRADEVLVWDAASGVQLQAFSGHNYAAFSPDWSILATIQTDDQVLLLYDVASGRLLHKMDRGERQAVEELFFSPDGRVLAQMQSGADRQLLLWDTSNGSLLRAMPEASGFLAFAPDGKTFATAKAILQTPSPADNLPEGTKLRYLYIYLWDTASGEQTGSLLVGGGYDSINAMAFSPDGKTIALTMGWQVSLWGQTGNAATWTTRWETDPGDMDCLVSCTIAFSPNGAVLAISGQSNAVINLLNPANGAVLAKLKGHKENPSVLADYTYMMGGLVFSADGTRLISSGEDGLLITWGVRP